MNSTQDFTKVVFCGNSTVGKTTLIRQITKGDVDPENESTIGVAFTTYEQNFKGQTFRLNLWDTAGQEQYRSLVNIYFRGADVVVIVFDLSNYESFEQVEDWIDVSIENVGKEPSFIFVGNKIDLPSAIPSSELLEFANDKNYISLSALNGEGVDILINDLGKLAEKKSMSPTEIPKSNSFENIEEVKNQNADDDRCC
ncbi:Rab family GTPase [Histomonas meleagridis]|uniref:Rab family GTPase n=1 Tax=Histomonas meleagridis TaxID=135588 RepID=UPI00355A6D45|nr:Rab family GTPase [Histomonas meleagridis]KAH0805025.1 Rab family GTPase [Histomonas meleagridis]